MKTRPSQTLWRARLAVLAGPCLIAQTAFAGEGGGGLYFGDLGQALAALGIFLLLLGILGKWAWKPIIEQLRTREERIERAVADAEKRHQDAKDLLERCTRATGVKKITIRNTTPATLALSRQRPNRSSRERVPCV